jgi:hypothetical protein
MAEENTEGTGMNKWKLAFNITIVIFLLVLGFFLGRKTIKEPETKVVTEYIQGETITDTLYYPQPYKVVIPVDTLGIIQQCIKDGIYKELWPERIVTEYIEVDKTDTTTIMLDWSTKRYYTETLFNNDTQGSCTFDAEVQYNRLKMIDYTYSPVVQTVTETKYIIKSFSPFIGVGYLTNPWDEVKNPMIQINGGVFFNEKYGIQAIYQRGFKLDNDYIGGGFIYKF